MLFWFSISFITNILGPLIPDIVANFELKDLALAGFIPTSFFIAYAIMSIPAGLMIDRYGEKPVLLIGFAMPLLATLSFAWIHTYPMLLASSFIIGLGMAMLQTVLNPLQRTVAGEENYAFIAEVAQFTFGIASFLSPLAYSYLVRNLSVDQYVKGKNILIDFFAMITPLEMPWVSLYWVFSLLLLVILIAAAISKFPTIAHQDGSKEIQKGGYLLLFKQPFVWLYFLGIFSYVASEQGVSIFMTTFLEKVHGVNPQIEGAEVVSYFWGAMTIGCLLGLLLLKLIDSKCLLKYSGTLSLILLLSALWGSKEWAMFAFPAIGFTISLMYGIIFSLGLNSVKSNHGSFAGILCSAIAGGAVGPLLISLVSDAISIQCGMFVICLFLLYITSIGFWAKPIINNKTIRLKQLIQKNKR
jgi:fucose permease